MRRVVGLWGFEVLQSGDNASGQKRGASLTESATSGHVFRLLMLDTPQLKEHETGKPKVFIST